MSLNHTTDSPSKCNQYPQTIFHPTRSDLYTSLPPIVSKKNEMSVSYRLFQRNYLPDEQVNETFATVEELKGLWKPRSVNSVPPFVMNCKCI